MAFRGLLRPGQGFKHFSILRRKGAATPSGRPYTGALSPCGELVGMITEADPKDIERYKRQETPITHTIVQRGSTARAKANDILELQQVSCDRDGAHRRFIVKGDPKDPGELGHFLIYHVEERKDLK